MAYNDGIRERLESRIDTAIRLTQQAKRAAAQPPTELEWEELYTALMGAQSAIGIALFECGRGTQRKAEIKLAEIKQQLAAEARGWEGRG